MTASGMPRGNTGQAASAGRRVMDGWMTILGVPEQVASSEGRQGARARQRTGQEARRQAQTSETAFLARWHKASIHFLYCRGGKVEDASMHASASASASAWECICPTGRCMHRIEHATHIDCCRWLICTATKQVERMNADGWLSGWWREDLVSALVVCCVRCVSVSQVPISPRSPPISLSLSAVGSLSIKHSAHPGNAQNAQTVTGRRHSNPPMMTLHLHVWCLTREIRSSFFRMTTVSDLVMTCTHIHPIASIHRPVMYCTPPTGAAVRGTMAR